MSLDRTYFRKPINVSFDLIDKEVKLGDTVNISNEEIKLADLMIQTNNFSIYKIDDTRLAKIYNKKINYKFNEEKVKLLLNLEIVNPHILKPIDLIYFENEFVGVVINYVYGLTLTNNFNDIKDNCSKRDELNILSQVISLTEELHSLNVSLGDFSLDSFLVDENLDVYYLSLDEGQINNYPSSFSGDYNLVAPDVLEGIKNILLNNELLDETFDTLLKKFYKTIYRDEFDDNYRLVTLLFKLLVDQYPFAQIINDDEELYDLIISGQFPYKLTEDDTKRYACLANNDAQIIWSHLPIFVKKLFIDYFENKDYDSVSKFKTIFDKYNELLNDGSLAFDDEADIPYPKNSMDYELVNIKMKSIEVTSFTLENAVKKAISILEEPNEFKYVKAIVENLKKSNSISTNVLAYEIKSKSGLSIELSVKRVNN